MGNRVVRERTRDDEECVGLLKLVDGLAREQVGIASRGRPRHVHVCDLCMDHALRLVHLRQTVQAGVGDARGPDVDLGPAAECAGLGVAAGQGVEYGRFPAPGKADDADAHVFTRGAYETPAVSRGRRRA